MKQYNILISNDDGIHAPGLERLARAACKFGRVWIAAPAGQCSGMSQKLTLFEPLTYTRVDYPVPVEEAWSIGGTPADCVKTALTTLLPVKPDWVFSGINKGFNAGYDICYSGTVGAAMEGLLGDIPAIAFSQDMNLDSRVVDAQLEEVLAQLLARPVSLAEIWNVNIPGCDPADYKGISWDVKVAPMSMFEDAYTKLNLEVGAILQPNVSVLSKKQPPEGSDIRAIQAGYTAIGRVRCMAKDKE